jgi:hypothetical protein
LRLADSAWALPSLARPRNAQTVLIEPAYSSVLASLICCHFAQRPRNTRVQRCKLK